jgi:putative ABC transport system permease protein
MYPVKHTVLFETMDGYSVKSFYNIQTSQEYLELMGIRTYPENSRLDFPGGVLINRTLADSIHFSNPYGMNLLTHYQFLDGKLRMNRVVNGFVDDFHYMLLNKPVEPLVILPVHPDRARYLAIKFKNEEREIKDKIIRQAWAGFDTINPLYYFHLQDNVDDYFAHNRNLTSFIGAMAWLCMIISFLGVLGITAYNIDQRSVEISIRKVLGANWTDFFIMFFSDYSLLYLIGTITGITLSWFVVRQWLKSFAFSSFGIQPFLLGGLLLGITISLAIIIHIIRVVYDNPSSALRKE